MDIELLEVQTANVNKYEVIELQYPYYNLIYNQKFNEANNFSRFELQDYEPGSRILIETHLKSVYDGVYYRTECAGFRIMVFGISEFPEQFRYPKGCPLYFYASEIKSIRILRDDEDQDCGFSETCPVRTGISYNEYNTVRNLVWNHYYLAVYDSRFNQVLNEIKSHDVIGIVALGSHSDKVRYTSISFFVIATRQKIYIFDIKLTPRRFWDMGLKNVLEDVNIQKVVYDSKTVGDLLFNRYLKIKMENVFDVQIADYLIRKNSGLSILKKRKSLSDLTDQYLNLPSSLLKSSELFEVSKQHFYRPASNQLKRDAALTAAFLISLKDAQQSHLLSDFNYASQIYADVMVCRSEPCRNNIAENTTPYDLKDVLDTNKFKK